MLQIHVLNVGHGDSIVLELVKSSGSIYAVIDSNAYANERPRALLKLTELNATELSFVSLTHPHRDHYRGMYEILRTYRGRINEFYTFPLARLGKRHIKQLAQRFYSIEQSQDDPELTKSCLEFAQILSFASSEFAPTDSWIPCGGEMSRIAPHGFERVEIYTILPPNRMRGFYLQQLMSSSKNLYNDQLDNHLSIAFLIKYGGVQIILGGDGTIENWIHHRRWRERSSTSIGSRVVLLPHHGSARDCRRDILPGLFCEEGGEMRYALISADGQSHPGEEVLDWLKTNNIQPYCTNLARGCGAQVRRLLGVAGLDPVLGRWINQVADHPYKVQVCQGDITVTIDKKGNVAVKRQYEHECGCSRSFERLFQTTPADDRQTGGRSEAEPGVGVDNSLPRPE